MEAALQEYNKALNPFQKSLKTGKPITFADPLSESTNAAGAIAAGRELETTLGTVLDQRHFAKAHPALKKRVEDLCRYAPIIEIFISSNPAIAAIVWGSVKLVLQSIVQFLDPFEKIFDCFQDVANTLPRIDIYQKHAASSPSIETALEQFHVNLVKVFAASLIFLKRRGLRALIATFASSSEPDFAKISSDLKNDAHQIDLLVSAVAFGAAAEKRARVTRRAFFQWLNADLENERRFGFAKAQIHPGTCPWIVETEEFRLWAGGLGPDFSVIEENDPCSVLEIQGEEGCGKTFLAAWVIEYLNQKASKGRCAFAYYFYGPGDRAATDDRALLAILIAQILKTNTALLNIDVVRYVQETCNTVVSEQECYEILQSLIQHFDSFIILIDSRYAFQLAKHYEFICHLIGKTELVRLDSTLLARKDGTQPRILLKAIFFFQTDRWPCWYRPENTRILGICHSNQVNDEDSYIPSQAEAVCNIHHESQQPEWGSLYANISNQLGREPRAHVLLLRLITEYLKVQTSPRAVEEALVSISPDVRSIYEEAFLRIQQFQDSRNQLGFNVLQWAAFAFRSLRISELADALIVRTGEGSLDLARRHSRLEYVVREICGPFTSIADGFVHPAYISIKIPSQDVTVSEPSPSADSLTLTYRRGHNATTRGYNPLGFETVGRNRIARACVAYLSLDSFAQSITTDRTDWTGKHPFLDYALHCWLHHILLLASLLKNPQKGYRIELGFDREILELVSKFVSLPQSRTYLQSLVVFSSVREALETLKSHMWPVRELEPLMQGSYRRVHRGQESDKASDLESWMRKAIKKLEMVQDLSIEEALPKLRDE